MGKTFNWTCRCGKAFTRRLVLRAHVIEEHPKVRASNSVGRNGRRCVVKKVRITVREE